MTKHNTTKHNTINPWDEESVYLSGLIVLCVIAISILFSLVVASSAVGRIQATIASTKDSSLAVVEPEPKEFSTIDETLSTTKDTVTTSGTTGLYIRLASGEQAVSDNRQAVSENERAASDEQPTNNGEQPTNNGELDANTDEHKQALILHSHWVGFVDSAPSDGSVGEFAKNYHITHSWSEAGQAILSLEKGDTFVVNGSAYEVAGMYDWPNTGTLEDVRSVVGADTVCLQTCIPDSDLYRIVYAV